MRVNISVSEKKQLINILKSDPMMVSLMSADYSQIDNYVVNNINNVAAIQQIIIRLFKINKYLLTNLLEEV